MPDNERSAKGALKIFLGFAPGVGKTFAMLDEAHRRKTRGQDVVVGFVEAYGRPATENQLLGLETVPPLELNGAKELDVDAVLRRNPDVVIVDEIAHQNAQGAGSARRVDDIKRILGAGISVLSTLNVGHLESLKDTVSEITGETITDTIPDSILQEAEEVEVVDLTPRALINRFERGDVYAPDEAARRRSFFREGNLHALRELALREAAGHVDEEVIEYRKDKRIEKPWATTDRVMICISPTRTSLRLLRRGWRLSQRLHGDVVAVHVEDRPAGERERKILQDDFALAQRLGIKHVTLHGSIVEQLVKYAKENNVTQIVLGRADRSRFEEMVRGSVVMEVAKQLPTVDILLVATESHEKSH